MKNKTFIKYAYFYNIGQYILDKTLIGYVFMILAELSIWWCVGFFTYLSITDYHFSSYVALIVPVVVKTLYASIEKYGELSVGFNLEQYFHITHTDIFKIRLLSRLFNLGEYFYIVALGFLSLHYFPIYVFIGTLIASYVLYDLLAYMSYQYVELERPVKEVLLLQTSILLYIFLPLILRFFSLNLVLLTPLRTLCIIATCVCVSIILMTLLCGKRKKKVNIIKSVREFSGVPELFTTLLKRDLMNFIKTRRSIYLMPFGFMIVLVYLDGVEILEYMLSFYVVLELSFAYGFNYYGHEKDIFRMVMLSPSSKETLVVEKNIFMLILYLVLSIPLIILGFYLKVITIQNMYYYIGMYLIASAICLILCSYFSIRFYHTNTKSKFGIRMTIIDMCLFAGMTLIQGVVMTLHVSQFIFMAVSCTVFMLAVMLCFLDVSLFSNYLIISEKRMLSFDID